jgi:hypothetical protein
MAGDVKPVEKYGLPGSALWVDRTTKRESPVV